MRLPNLLVTKYLLQITFFFPTLTSYIKIYSMINALGNNDG